MLTMVISKYFLLILVFYELPTGRALCESHRDCKTCIAHKQWWVSCRWCALTEACHQVFDYYDNVCSSEEDVKIGSKLSCADVRRSDSADYNSRDAVKMALWSSLAYTSLERRDIHRAKAVIWNYIDPSYQLVEYITSNCGMPIGGDDCAVVIITSSTDQRLVVSFRGTKSNFQLFEEFLGPAMGKVEFTPTGGQILSYFMEAHKSLYDCVQLTIRKLLMRNPHYMVYVTGHSLGGAEAQLTAANLIADGLVTNDKLIVYTFGSPRVGDASFAYGYDRIVHNSWRVVNRDDPIPKIVPTSIMLMPYAYHTRREIYYNTVVMDTNTNYTECRGNEDKTCSRKDGICLTQPCIYSHFSYFLSAIHNGIRVKIAKKETWSGNTTTIGTCTCYNYAEIW